MIPSAPAPFSLALMLVGAGAVVAVGVVVGVTALAVEHAMERAIDAAEWGDEVIARAALRLIDVVDGRADPATTAAPREEAWW